MARYRLLEKNLITNEYADKGWIEGSSQKSALRGSNLVAPEIEYLLIPEPSYHPVKMVAITAVRWENANAEIEEFEVVED